MKGFYHIWAWRPSWSCDLDLLYTHWFPLPIDASYKIWLWLAMRFQRRRSLKLWTDGRTDAGRTPDHGHPISSTCEPNGSGELKTCVNIIVMIIKECQETTGISKVSHSSKIYDIAQFGSKKGLCLHTCPYTVCMLKCKLK